MKYLNYKYTDSGFCRVVYRTRQNRWYCLQDMGIGRNIRIELFACTKDGEPSYPVSIDRCNIAFSPGTDQIDLDVNEFLTKQCRNY